MNVKHYFSAANILSQSTRENCINAMKNLPSVSSVKQSASDVERRASVLVPLCNVKGEMALLYTLRSMELSSHKGHVSFPGGKYDQTDITLVNTALRETEEELGIPKDNVEVWGEANQYPSRNFEIDVTPVIGFIRDYEKLQLKVNPSEVAEVFTVSIENLADPQYFGFNSFKNGWTVPVFMAGPHKIWGLTAVITHLFLSCLLPVEAYPMQFKHLGYTGKDKKFELPKSAL